MAHQMKHLCGFSVFHCVEGAFGAASGGTPKMKNGAPRDELKNGCGRGWAIPDFYWAWIRFFGGWFFRSLGTTPISGKTLSE